MQVRRIVGAAGGRPLNFPGAQERLLATEKKEGGLDRRKDFPGIIEARVLSCS